MKIKTLENKEEKIVKKYSQVLVNSIIKSIKKKGVKKAAIKENKKTTDKVGKELTKSGLGLGMQWLEDLK